MSCKNCFNGCASTTSDKCVKYTGVDIPELNIETGDSLAVVEANITSKILEIIQGTGIVMDIDDLCDLITDNLPEGPITLVDYLTALIAAVCGLDMRVTTNLASINKIEADYTLECLTGVDVDSGSHDILQATITFLCALNETVTTLASNLENNYTKTADLPTVVADIIGEEPATSLMSSRMVPMTVVEYYGSTGNFDGSGAGIGDWAEIYLCNGANGTPDKRGRVGIGATTGMGGGAMSPAVDPAVVGNPAYTLLSAGGSNVVTLAVAQMPLHSHTASFSGTPHTHDIAEVYTQVGAVSSPDIFSSTDNVVSKPVTSTSSSTATGTVTVNNTGSGEAHENIQPVLGCYYIMYIPA